MGDPMGRRMWRLVFDGDRVSVQEGENSGDERWREFHNNVNVLSAPEL